MKNSKLIEKQTLQNATNPKPQIPEIPRDAIYNTHQKTQKAAAEKIQHLNTNKCGENQNPGGKNAKVKQK